MILAIFKKYNYYKYSKMKANFLLALLLLGTISIVYSQQITTPVEVKISETFKDNKKFTNLAFSVPDGEGGVFLGRNYNKGCYLEHYDSNLNLLDEYEMEVDNKRSEILNAFVNDRKLMVVESFRNKDVGEIQFIVHKTDFENFSFNREILFTISIDEVDRDLVKTLWSKTIFSGNAVDEDWMGKMVVSKNRNYVVFYQDMVNNGKESHKIFVFNGELEKQYENSFEEEVKDRLFTLQNIDINDNDGTIYLLGKNRSKEARKKDEGGKYYYELYKINADSKRSVSFDSDDKFAASLTTIVGDEKLYCAGYYSDKNDYRYKGVVHFNINPENLQINSAKYSPFSEQFILDKYGKEKDKELRNVVFRNSHLDEDENLYLAGEEFYVRTHTSYGNGVAIRYIVYYYFDIIAAKLDPSGELIWSRNINKTQTSSDVISPYQSYASSYYDGKLFFLINGDDDIRKMKNDRIRFPSAAVKKMNLYAIEIDSEGEFNYENILPEDDADVAFGVAEAVIMLNGKQIILQGRRRSKKQIAKLEFN